VLDVNVEDINNNNYVTLLTFNRIQIVLHMHLTFDSYKCCLCPIVSESLFNSFLFRWLAEAVLSFEHATAGDWKISHGNITVG